jgi:hypothetical protein
MCENKKCSKCGQIKPLNEFNKNKTKKNGVSSLCKLCHSEYRKKHYLGNKDKVLKQVAEYNLKNPQLKTKINENKLFNRINKKAGRIYECKCDECDNIIFVTKKDIEENNIKYCSKECKKKQNKSDYYHYLKQIEKRAIKINKEFNLDENFIKELLEVKQKNRCNYSNIEIRIYDKNAKKSLNNSASLDRIDSQKGYTKDNVHWVCLGINYMKLNYSDEETHKLLRLIKESYN